MFTLPFNHRDNIDLSNVTSSLTQFSDGDVSVGWKFLIDGTGQSFIGGSIVETWTWCTPTNSAYADNYEILFNFNTNSTPDPSQLWYSLSTEQGFGASSSAQSGSSSGNFTFFIRRIGSTLILSSTTVSWSLDSGA
jgi:hypothetical protein